MLDLRCMICDAGGKKTDIRLQKTEVRSKRRNVNSNLNLGRS